MANEIKTLFSVVKGVKQDWKVDWKESSKSDWKFDFDAVAGNQPSAPPLNTVLPVITGTATVGSVLTVSTGTWTGTPTPTYTYQWKRGTTDIAGATAATYTLVADDSGKAINCVVRGTNAISTGAVTAVAVNVA